jgi:hypothetical protein
MSSTAIVERGSGTKGRRDHEAARDAAALIPFTDENEQCFL